VSKEEAASITEQHTKTRAKPSPAEFRFNAIEAEAIF